MIKPKEKPCKGINKASHFVGCNKMVLKRTYGLCDTCYIKWLYSTEEGSKQISKLAIKAKKQVKQEEKQKVDKMKKEVTNWKSKLQIKVQEIARLIDYGQPCTATGIREAKFAGGHVFSKGANPQMRFNLHNIHKQSFYSNSPSNHDSVLREGIANIYGDKYLEFIKSLVKEPQPKWSNKHYEEIYRRACKMANNLKKNQRVRTPQQRITMRNTVNSILNIYPSKQNIYNN